MPQYVSIHKDFTDPLDHKARNVPWALFLCDTNTGTGMNGILDLEYCKGVGAARIILKRWGFSNKQIIFYNKVARIFRRVK